MTGTNATAQAPDDGVMGMDEAPERIWTVSTKGKCHIGFDTPSMNYVNEYVRADILAQTLAANAALEAVVAAADGLAEAAQNMTDYGTVLAEQKYHRNLDTALTAYRAAKEALNAKAD